MLTDHSNKNFKKRVVEGLTFLYSNIRSVSANLEDLEISLAKSKPSVIALTETWWKSEHAAELFCLVGYQRLFAGRGNWKRGSGEAI